MDKTPTPGSNSDQVLPFQGNPVNDGGPGAAADRDGAQPPSICHLTQAAPITADFCHPFGQTLGRFQDRSAFRVILEDPDEPQIFFGFLGEQQGGHRVFRLQLHQGVLIAPGGGYGILGIGVAVRLRKNLFVCFQCLIHRVFGCLGSQRV